MNDTDETTADVQIAQLIRVMTHGLRERIQVWAAMLLTFALFAASVWRLHWIPFSGGCVFALFVVVLLRKRGRDG